MVSALAIVGPGRLTNSHVAKTCWLVYQYLGNRDVASVRKWRTRGAPIRRDGGPDKVAEDVLRSSTDHPTLYSVRPGGGTANQGFGL